ncbi:phosphoglycolate phosphatase [Enterobacteriaceae bacterium YMB-R22]|uniref:phosphoglycolate phosphatase n=1 Tax=Tenebrionicola larvae TaxID=2815733 RepID=UPI00201152E8|nr:phosphoglycolate phosphatase [Tenebrionicola larvae]MBV4411839.1 phosphoglycolate phosphatase [Tenebrionicola larvae]
MTIKSFAENNVHYSDLQVNKADIPQEILANGFKPPIKMPDGSVQQGDPLTAQYLNYMLNEIFSRLSALEGSGKK